MIDWFFHSVQESMAQLIFFSIFLAGLVFSVGSLILGGGHDDAGHDFFGGHDADTDAGDGHGDHGGHEGDSLGFFSIRGISLMATGFGGLSFIIYSVTRKLLLASAGGLMFAWVFAGILLLMLRTLKKQQASSLIDPQRIVGATGMVTTTVPADAFGEVRISVDGTDIVRMARSEVKRELPTGTVVRVVRYLGGSVTVEPIS